jgi:beta-mannosidase
MPHSPEAELAPSGCSSIDVDCRETPSAGPRLHVDGHETLTLSTGWQAACASADRDCQVQDLDPLSWIPARVPGTAAGALRDAGLWRAGEPRDFDAEDWWFRTYFDAEPVQPGEEAVLCLDGIATVAEVYLNGERVLDSDSMFAAHALPVGGRLTTASGGGAHRNELAIRCRALAPLLGESRRPRARWRTRLVSERNLRFFRTMLLGRAPGFAPGPAAVGPWRAVRLERRRRVAVEQLTLRPRIEGARGVLSAAVRLRPLGATRLGSVAVELDGPSGTYRAELALSGPPEAPTAVGELTVPGVARWWPHTHGEPLLHHVRLLVDVVPAGTAQGGAAQDGAMRDGAAWGGAAQTGAAPRRIVIDAGKVGFRELAFGATPTHDVEEDGLDLHVNGVRVFVRGAVWTPIDPIGMACSEHELRAALDQAREAGMNMLRLPGTSAYETSAFHDLCDELGIFVWQDFMFANFDYPLAHQPFRASVTREATAVLDALGGRPSLAVLCGNSEVEQQVAMLGLDPALGRGELFGALLPELVRESGVDAVYVPSAPCGGELPFRPDRGIANYYGVGGYRRPLEDARRAGVRFAAECLAFANVPSDTTTEPVPRDAGADWDFADVRDHYLGLLFELDPSALRAVDRERYFELSRAVSGEVMAEVFGEWRRAASPCGGGLVLWLRDLLPGAGWGLVDHRGAPKVAYHHLKRALAPVAVWTIDEGLGGIVIHVANDCPQPLSASLRVALYRDHEMCIEQVSTPLELEPHSQCERNVETMIGRFVDVAWAYRFGPPAQHAIVVSLERDSDLGAGAKTIGRAVRFPAGRPLERESPEQLGLEIETETTPLGDGEVRLALTSRRLAYGVRIEAPGFLPSDDGFFIEPGGTHNLTLRPTGPDSSLGHGRVLALNMDGQLELAGRVPVEVSAP